jgi:hypothetical protein
MPIVEDLLVGWRDSIRAALEAEFIGIADADMTL